MDFADDADISGRTRRCPAGSEWHLSQGCHLHVHPIGQRTEIAWTSGFCTGQFEKQQTHIRGPRHFGADQGPMLQFQHEVLGHHPFDRISEERHNAATALPLGKLLGIVVFLSAFL